MPACAQGTPDLQHPRDAVLVGGLRVLGVDAAGVKRGVFTGMAAARVVEGRAVSQRTVTSGQFRRQTCFLDASPAVCPVVRGTCLD
jgi:hypothetical protein